jgi:hypothetical protein
LLSSSSYSHATVRLFIGNDRFWGSGVGLSEGMGRGDDGWLIIPLIIWLTGRIRVNLSKAKELKIMKKWKDRNQST